MAEEDEDLDIMDVLASKGTALDAFKTEFLDTQRQLDIINAINTSKEREIDMRVTDLRMVREQLAFSRRNVDELASQQEVLRDTIDHGHHKRDILIQSEKESRTEISNLSGLFAELREALAVGADWTPEQTESRVALEKEHEFLVSKLENKTSQLAGLRNDIERTYEWISQVESQMSLTEQEADEIDKKRIEVKREVSKLISKKEATEKRVFDLRGSLAQQESELSEKYRAHALEEKALKTLQASTAKAKQQMEQFLKEYEKLYQSLTDLNRDLEKQKITNIKSEEEISEKQRSIAEIDSEIKRTRKVLKETNDLRDGLMKKCNEIDAEKHAAETKAEELMKNTKAVHDAEISGVHKEMERLDHSAATLRQELEVLTKKHLGSEKAAKAMADLAILNRNGKINLGVEIKVLEEEVAHHKAKIRQLLAEKEKYEHDSEIANQQYYTSLEELKLQEMQITELNRRIMEDQMKLKQKQSLYESVRSDRNLFSKQLLDAQEEIQELKRKFRSMNHMIEQMNEDITVKDKAIVKEHFLHHSVDKERELLRNELTKIRKQVQASEGIIENQRVEIVKLQRIIEEADQERLRQRNELASVLSERNLLTGQLVKRNEELNNMYERIKTLRGGLKVGERNFARHFEQLARWQKELISLVNNHNETIVALSSLDDLRHRVVHLERDILREQTRSRALLDELQTPMNVHRWRILESSDPKRFDKLTQIHALQKQLVQMSDRVVQNELLIQEKEKVYVELKNVIARHPGPEVQEQILVYQTALKDKQLQLVALGTELEMYLEQVKRFKEDIADRDAKLAQLSKQWMRQTRKAAAAAAIL